MSLRNTGKGSALVLASVLLSLTLYTGMASAEGAGLNGIGEAPQTQTTTPAQTAPAVAQPAQTAPATSTEPSGSEVVGDLFSGVGVDSKAAQKANEYMNPISQMANIVFAVILSIAFIGMFVITGLDLLYIAVPPVRNLLHPGGGQASGGGGGMGGMGGGFGGGGFGGGMGGMGGGMGGGQSSGASSTLSRWISDEAVAAAASLSGGGQQGGGMGGFGGMGGQQQEPATGKSVIFSYFKKRAVFLVLFGVCAVLLSTTIFTDVGVELGNWVLNRLMGLENNIPE